MILEEIALQEDENILFSFDIMSTEENNILPCELCSSNIWYCSIRQKKDREDPTFSSIYCYVCKDFTYYFSNRAVSILNTISV